MHLPNGYFAILYREASSRTIGVRFPEHPGVVTYGSTWDEARDNAREALSAALETDYERGYQLPAARRHKARRGERVIFVQLDPEVLTAYLLRSWREESGLTQQALAKRLGISYQAYQRMERPGRSNLTVATLEKVASALGRKLVIGLA